MARSTYIYLALMGNLPIRAFTVKREMQDWLRKQDVEVLRKLSIYAMRDGDVESSLKHFKTAESVLAAHILKGQQST